MTMPKYTPEDIVRFWSKVKNGDADQCWEWQRGKMSSGYGKFWCQNRDLKAHRVAYSIKKGDPGDLHVLHKCDNPSCCNPSHLFLGSHTDNMRDKTRKGRGNWVKGEQHYKAKLTSDQVQEIRDLYKRGGISQQALSTLYKISASQICDIVNGKQWR